ncbi:transmembrane protein 177 [Brachionichthys hirsutus]|uniref:transmembrane protein 177 n=1 Tax=Brachionichthys hirsutus TaxID=412623 RepID=UPI0036053490
MASRFLKLSVLLRKYRTPLLIASCGGFFAANLLYDAFPGAIFRPVHQAWYRGEPAKLPKELDEVFLQVMKEYGIGSSKNFTAFASYGFCPVAAGVPRLPAGAQIGIPMNFNSTADNKSAIIKRQVLIDGKAVDWSSDSGSALKESLVFSHDAQRFAIAREVARVQSGGPVLTAAVGPFCLAGTWAYGAALRRVFLRRAGPALFRGMANVAALGLGAVSYLVASDAVGQWVDLSSDMRAAGLSLDYAKGGVEFYDKILARNKTLRSLMGRKGADVFTPSGNLFPANLIQKKHAPYTSRREEILTLLGKQSLKNVSTSK